MADNDLLFNITAIDHYKAEMDEAYALAQRQAQADQASINISQGVEQAEAARAAAGRNVAETEKDVATETANSTQKIGELSDATKEAGESARGSVQGFESFKGTLVAVQSRVALAQEAIGGLKQVWDFAKEGAQNQQIAASFERTAKSIGGNAGEIVAALDAAAKGTVDDEELMQASTRALTLGVAKNGDDLIKVMQLARSAALAFGGDTGQAFETINYAIGNLAPRALKQFGIVVSLKEANDAYAKSLGLTADQLTEEQQRQALLNAVLEQGTKNFGDVANQAATTAEKMKAVEASAANVLDVFKEIAATGLAAGFDIIKAPRNALEAFSGTAKKLRDDLANGKISVKDYNDALSGMANAMSGIVAPAAVNAALDIYRLDEAQAAQLQTQRAATTGNLGYASSFDETNRAIERNRQAQRDLQIEQRAVEQGARNQADTYATLDAAMDRTTAKASLLAASQKIVAGEMADLKVAMAGALKNEQENFSARQDDLTKKSSDLAEQIEKLQASQGRAVTVNRGHALSANELTLAQLKLGESQTRLSQETDPLKQAELRVQIDKQKESLDGAAKSVTSYIDNSKKITELQGQYDTINAEIAKNTAAHDEATKKILFGYAEQRLAVDGLTDTEAKALDALAVKWNLKSQSDVEAMQAIRDAAAGLAKDGSIDLFTDNIGEALDKAEGKVSETAQSIQRATAGIAAAGIPIPVSANTTQAEKDIDDAKKKITAEPLVLIAKLSITEQAKGVAGDTLAERTAQVGKQTDALKGSAQAVTSATDLITTYSKAAIDSTGKFADSTAANIGNVADKARVKFGDVSTSVINAITNMARSATGDLNQVSNYVDRLPTYKEFVYKITVKGANDIPPVTRGAQYGADFIVPPNPRGGSGDYFPVIAAPMEHVVITPAGKSETTAKAQNITTNNTTYNLYDALAAKQVAEQKRLKQLESVMGAM